MYINPFERMKNLKINTDDLKINTESIVKNDKVNNFNNGNNTGTNIMHKKNYDLTQGLTGFLLSENILTSYEISRDLIKNLKEKNSEAQFFLTLIEKQKKEVMLEISNSLFAMPVINIDLLRIVLYVSPFLFLLKKVIKGLPKVNIDDKKILWDRVKLFARTLNNEGKGETAVDSNSVVIVNELEFDDPLEYIKKEFEEIIRAYEIKESIVITFSNIDIIGYKKFRKLFDLLQAIFKGITSFKFIVGLEPILIESYVKQNFGIDVGTEMIIHELGIYDKKYTVKNESYDEKITYDVPEKTGQLNKQEKVAEQNDNEPVGYDYWNARGGR